MTRNSSKSKSKTKSKTKSNKNKRNVHTRAPVKDDPIKKKSFTTKQQASTSALLCFTKQTKGKQTKEKQNKQADVTVAVHDSDDLVTKNTMAK